MDRFELEQLSDKQLIKAYKALNRYEWSKVLGTQPQDWDRLPDCPPIHGNIFTAVRYRKTKLDIIAPLQDDIAMIIGRRWLKENSNRALSIKDEFFSD